MTVLVTGGAGYIGHHIVHALMDEGRSTVVIDDLSTGTPAHLPKDTPLFVGNVADEYLVDSIITKHQIDTIIHLAGSVVVPESIRNPLHYYRNNTTTTRNLLDVAVRRNVSRFIFSSSAAVYGNPDRSPVTEDAPTRPLSPYGSSKIMVETMLRDVSVAHPLNFIILRYFNVAGADPKCRTGLTSVSATHLMKMAVEAATNQRPQIVVFGTDYATPDGSCIRDFLHVSDLADIHCTALSYLEAGGPSQILNCGYGRGNSVLEVIAAVRRISRVNFVVQYADRRPGDIERMVADTRRIRALFDWTPRYDNLDLIATHALAWEKRVLCERAALAARQPTLDWNSTTG